MNDAQYRAMKTYTASQARTRFGAFIDDAQRGPVRVTRRGQAVGVLLGTQDFEIARAFYADRLRQTMNLAAEQAAGAGLTVKMADDLLADES
jgi:prevent-host-death family protein